MWQYIDPELVKVLVIIRPHLGTLEEFPVLRGCAKVNGGIMSVFLCSHEACFNFCQACGLIPMNIVLTLHIRHGEQGLLSKQFKIVQFIIGKANVETSLGYVYISACSVCPCRHTIYAHRCIYVCLYVCIYM